MKKNLIAVLITVTGALGVATYAGAGAGCCAIPQRTAAVVPARSATRVATLHIEGMTCGSCATAVKRVLSKVDGVKDAQVSFKEKKGNVTYDSAKVTPEKIARAVEEKLPTYKATVVK